MSEPRQRKELTRAYPLVLENKARSKKDPKGSFKDQGSGKTSGTQKSREYFHQKRRHTRGHTRARAGVTAWEPGQ